MTDQIKERLDYLKHLRSLFSEDRNEQSDAWVSEEITQVNLDLMHLGYFE